MMRDEGAMRAAPSTLDAPATRASTEARDVGRESQPLARTARIAVLPGDGVGPEVMAEGVRALRAVGERWGHRFELSEALVGGCAIDERGSALPADTLSLCRASD